MSKLNLFFIGLFILLIMGITFLITKEKNPTEICQEKLIQLSTLPLKNIEKSELLNNQFMQTYNIFNDMNCSREIIEEKNTILSNKLEKLFHQELLKLNEELLSKKTIKEVEKVFSYYQQNIDFYNLTLQDYKATLLTRITNRKLHIHQKLCQKKLKELIEFNIDDNTKLENFNKEFGEYYNEFKSLNSDENLTVKAEETLLKKLKKVLINESNNYQNKLSEANINKDVDRILEKYLSSSDDFILLKKQIYPLIQKFQKMLNHEAEIRKNKIHIESCTMLNKEIKKYMSLDYSQKPFKLQGELGFLLLNYQETSRTLKCMKILDINLYLESLKESMIKDFTLSKNKIKNLIITKSKKIEKSINDISKKYELEIQALHPIDSDEEVAKKHLIDPFIEAIAQYLNKINQDVNNHLLQNTTKILNNFMKYCDNSELYYYFDKEIPLKAFIGKDIITYDNNFSEEGVWKSVADESLNWIPAVGDVKEVFEINLNNETRNRANARNYMANKLKYLQSDIQIYLNQHIALSQNNLENYLIESLSFKEKI